MHVLALSSSRVGGGGYLAAALPMINEFLGAAPLRIVFVPFAAVDGDYENYANNVRVGLSMLPHVINVATRSNAKSLIEKGDVIMVGGGNTFKLLHDLYHYDLFPCIQEKVAADVPYIGWSAGANLTGLSISTTNDMPIIQPLSFKSFGFFPFQINPHYHNVVVEGFHGETRDQRLTEFLHLNPNIPVIGLPEGTALQLISGKCVVLGSQPAILFQYNSKEEEINKRELFSGTDLSFLVQ